MATLVFADGSRRPAPDDGTVAQLIQSAAPGLAAEAVAARVNGVVADLSSAPPAGAEIAPLTRQSPESLEVLRHSLSHVMAAAVVRLFPDVKLAIGPAIESGFYYDFDLPHKFTPEDLARIEAEMKRVVAENEPFKRFDLPRPEAHWRMESAGQPYKTELIQGFEEDRVELLLERFVHRRLRRAAPAEHRGLRRRLQTAQCRRRVLARRRAQRDAPAHLRHGILDAAGAG